MEYQLAKELKEAGFPQKEIERYEPQAYVGQYVSEKQETGFYKNAYAPSLSELIEACDTVFFDLSKISDGWIANDHYNVGRGSTPEEAVAYLWLDINKPL